MPFGFGILDYVVVTLIVISTTYMLARAPQRLLLWLPTFLTIDFFIPLMTQVTPSRLVPFMLGGWLILSRKAKLRSYHTLPTLLFLAVLALSVVYSLEVGDAGTRPLFRAAHYIGLLFLFAFLISILKNDEHIEMALWGLFLAGLIHGGHALYQLFASYTGLPFRGIVYGVGSEGVTALTAAGMRVNGLADEPKRLGYILFAAALAATYFAFRRSTSSAVIPSGTLQRLFRNKGLLLATAGLCLVMSLLTYSGSYFFAAAVVLLILLATFSTRTLSYVVLGGVLALLAIAAFPEKFDQYQSALTKLLEARTQELESGLEAKRVYRQEFFAREYVNEAPSSLVFGVGIGRYNRVLADRFGEGAGYGLYGGIMPLNSQFYEIGFDLGAVGLLLLYAGGAVLVLRIGRRTLRAYVVSTILLFLIVQSLTVEDKHLLVFVAALGSALIWQRAAIRQAQAQVVPNWPEPRRSTPWPSHTGPRRNS